MGKQTTITNSTLTNSSNPRLSRSEIIHSTISNLDESDSITRCYINASTISKERNCESSSRQSSIASGHAGAPVPAPAPASGGDAAHPHHNPTSMSDGDGGRRPKRQGRITIRLRRSEITSSTLHNTSLSRSIIARSTLSHIPRARSLQSTDSILDTINPLRRATVSKSTISDGSALARSELNDSVVSKSAIVRSRLEKSHVSGSRVKKSKLVHCQVSDCVVINCEFEGMVLKNGVWRGGRFLGPTGVKVDKKGADGDGRVFGGEKLGKPLGNEEGHTPEDWMGDLDSEMESSGCDDSDTEEEVGHGYGNGHHVTGNEKDLPPPYTP
ncbi:hypothetical protein BDW69DRAFT_184265 [Aspergillus filifer]